jgi:hypothetical protein
MYRPSEKEEYGVIYVGHSDDLSTEQFPFDHPAAACWLKRVDRKRFELYIAYYEVPGGTRSHREEISRELIAIYRPGCNPDQYDRAWEEHWIGEYHTPGTTGPLTTHKDPSATGC